MAHAYIALGSNLQDPKHQVKLALEALKQLPNSRLIKTSSLYKTAPIGYEASKINEIPDFINAVAWIETSLTPEDVLSQLFVIENNAGRERPYRFAPRVLDCDLLLYDEVVMQSDTLTLPHPRMHLRGFVLRPLFEVNPVISIPMHGNIADLMHEQDFSDVVQLSDDEFLAN
jgi:2-amino-4-hydroxy-6-hydroxymethyldihydropteridine diphosphokinase